MSVYVSVTLDGKDIARFGGLKGNVRVAAAVALTRTAKDAQARLKEQAPGVFHLRNSWVVGGIRIDPANPGSLNAKVGSIDKYMARHVFGETKRPAKALSIRRNRDSNGRLATGGLLIAPYGPIGSALTHRKLRSKLKRVDGQKKKTFQILSKGGAKVLLVRRTSKKRNPLQVIAFLDREAPEKRIWHMETTVSNVVGARFGEHFEAALAVGAAMKGR